jgi:hypothetical protein
MRNTGVPAETTGNQASNSEYASTSCYCLAAAGVEKRGGRAAGLPDTPKGKRAADVMRSLEQHTAESNPPAADRAEYVSSNFAAVAFDALLAASGRPLRISVYATNAGLTAVDVDNPRSALAISRLAGRPIPEALARLPVLMTVCGTAHTLALLRAVEAALDITVAPAQAAVRHALVETEWLTALAWRTLVDWAMLADGKPRLEDLREIRALAALLKAALVGGQDWARIGGIALAPDCQEAGRLAGVLAKRLADLFPEAAEMAQSPRAECARAASIPARLIAEAAAHPLTATARHALPLVSRFDPSRLHSRLAADAGFAQVPVIDGREPSGADTPAEVGALASGRHDELAAALAERGPTTALRLLAQALDLHAVPRALSATLTEIGDDEPVPTDCSGSGTAAAVVETARGPLAYLAAVGNGRLLDVRSVAPTEWNFHAGGPCVETLRQRPLSEMPMRLARLVVQSLDPCIPFEVDLRPAPAAGGRHA